MQIAPDFLLVGLLSQKTFTLRNMPPPLSFCAEPKSEVAESIIKKITLDFRERGDRPRLWVEGQTKTFSHAPLPPWSGPSPQGEGLSSLFEKVDSATPGKPFVQNDIRVRWQEGRRKQLFNCAATNGTKGTNCIKCTAFILFQIHESIKKNHIPAEHLGHKISILSINWNASRTISFFHRSRRDLHRCIRGGPRRDWLPSSQTTFRRSR